VADGDRLYLAGHDPESQRETIRAIRLADGAEVWQSDVDPANDLVLAGGRLFRRGSAKEAPPPDAPGSDPSKKLQLVTRTMPFIEAVDAATGRLFWRHMLECEHATDILADADHVYVICGGSGSGKAAVYALATATGAMLWTSPLPFFGLPRHHALGMKPGLLLAAGETWSVENGSATLLVALTPADGRRLWQHQLPGVAGWGRAYPDAVGGTTLAPGDFCIQSAYKFYWWKQYDELLAWDLSTGKLAWKRSAHTYELTETTDGGIATDGARIYINDRPAAGGEIHAFDLKTGWPLWQSSFNRKGPALSHPVVSGQAVMVLSGDGTLHGLAAASGRAMWKVVLAPFYKQRQFSRDPSNRVLVAGGKILVFNGQTVWALKPAETVKEISGTPDKGGGM
jgi:outer membrane protein assembly factor BamB